MALFAAPQQAAPTPPVPHRIVSVVPAVTEMLFAIGDGASVVGVSTYDHYPKEATARPRVGALIDPDLERILALRPDLMIVYDTQTDLIARLDRAGVPMYRYEHAGLADITDTIRRVGERVGHEDEANRLAAKIEQQLNAIRARVAGRPRPKTLIIMGREDGELRGIFASGGVGFLHDMVETAGGDDVFSGVKQQSVQATTESILTHPPDVILELRVGDYTDAQRAREAAVWDALPSLPAVRDHRVFMLTDEMLSIPGPRVADATLVFAKTLHPEAFR